MGKKEVKMPEKILDNDLFVQKNFEKLVKKYPHRRIVICQGEIFTGDDAVDNAREKYPKAIPLWFHVPGSENFVHLL